MPDSTVELNALVKERAGDCDRYRLSVLIVSSGPMAAFHEASQGDSGDQPRTGPVRRKASPLTDYPDPQRTFGYSYKSNCYEWEIGFVPADVPLSTAATSGLQWTQQGGIGFKGAIPHPLAQFMLWARPSRYASQQSAHPSHQEGCRGPASSRRPRRDRICCLRSVGCFRR